MTGSRANAARFHRELLRHVAAREADPSLAVTGPDLQAGADLALSRVAPVARHSEYEVNARLRAAATAATLRVRRIPLHDMDHWRIDRDTGNIEHASGRFFTVLGAAVRHRHLFMEQSWNQPFIDQAEVGILGILAAEIDGILHFCLQSKEEPGNLNAVQLSPTVQATFSNYTRSHGGQRPPLLDFFLTPDPARVIYSRLQTEDGGRFLFKSNLNIVIRCTLDEVPPLPDRYLWLTLRQISALMRRDNVINACARSILSALLPCGPFTRSAVRRAAAKAGWTLPDEAELWPAERRKRQRMHHASTVRPLLDWRDEQKSITHLHVKRTPLASLSDWHIDDEGFFSHKQGHFFRVVGLSVQSGSREIAAWTQPILENPREGIIGLLLRQTANGPEFLMQAKAEPGNRPPVQLAPTVQFTPANYLDNVSLQKPFLFDEFVTPRLGRIVRESRQSEEGARFFREAHLHRILEIPPDQTLDLPENYRWFNLDDLRFFLHLGEHVNSCARSILACLI